MSRRGGIGTPGRLTARLGLLVYVVGVAVTVSGALIGTAYIRFDGGREQCARATDAMLRTGQRDLVLLALVLAAPWVALSVIGSTKRLRGGLWIAPVVAATLFPALGIVSGLHVSDWTGWAWCASGV